MGWLETRNLSKMYVRRRGFFGLSRGGADPEDDDIGDVGDAAGEEEDEERQDPRAPDDGLGEVWALQDVNLKIGRGEAVAVVGHSGSGKSTLLRILAGVSRPTSGEVCGDGLVVAMNHIRTAIAPRMTGRRNLLLLEALLGMPKGRLGGRMEEIAAFAGMEEWLDQKVARYSKSMYAKLALSAALHCEPGIVLIDDGIGGGDAPFRERLLERLRDLVRNGTTLIYASQKGGGLVEELCRRAVWLSAGKVVADGPSKTILVLYHEIGDDPQAIQDVTLALSHSSGDSGTVDAGAALDEMDAGVTVDEAGVMIPRRRWLSMVEDWRKKQTRVLARWERASADRRLGQTEGRGSSRVGYLRADRTDLVDTVVLRVIDGDAREVSSILPGETVRVEIEIVARHDAEIGLRFEVQVRNSILMASEPPIPLSAAAGRRYLMTFDFDGAYTAQEIVQVLYKFRARLFFRRPGNAWEDLAVATAWLHVRGEIRMKAEQAAFERSGEPTAFVDPVPDSLEGIEARRHEDKPFFEPLLRPDLGWRIYHLDSLLPSDGARSGGEPGDDATQDMSEPEPAEDEPAEDGPRLVKVP